MSVVEATATATAWVVMNPAAEVVLICAGADAIEVAEEWAKKGYTVVEMASVTA
jgi:hypothetical protein